MKKVFFLLSVCLMLTSLVFAQTVVEPGDGTLSAAVAAAADGDVLVLKSGGAYTETSMAALPTKIENKAVTIKAEDDYTERPLITVPAVPSGAGNDMPNLFELNMASITLQGVEIDGGMADTSQFLPIYEVISNTPELANTAPLIKVTDCFVHDLLWPLGYVVGGGGEYSDLFIGADSCIIQNNLFYKCPKTISFQNTICQYLEVSNNTFWHGTRHMIRVENSGNGNNPVILIDHNTFYSNAHKGIQYRPGTADNNMITITNNIFAKLENNYGDNYAGDLRDAVEIRDGMNTLISNNCLYLTRGFKVADETDLVDNLIDVDQKFATDPGNYPEANADFTLAADSPCLGQATDGTAIGDSRWDPGTTKVEYRPLSAVNTSYNLEQNYPNPFNPETTISFSLESKNWTTLTIHNTMGQVVATVINKNLDAGFHSVTFNASELPSGLYFYRVVAGDFNATKKMMLLK